MVYQKSKSSDRLKLIPPSEKYADQIKAYREEFLTEGDILHGASNLSQFADPFEWLQFVKNLQMKETCPPGWSPARPFLCVRQEDDRVVGMIHICYELNDYLFHYGGHIGYSIRKSERGKGYATQQLRLALVECMNMEIERVLITCDRNNEASKRTILSVNGVLENEVFDESDQTMTQRYWVTIA